MIQKLKAIASASLMTCAFAHFAHADEEKAATEGESKIKVEEVTEKKNKVAGDIDEEITNAKLRAESGSKSKFSMSMGAGYTGGSISRPFGEERPNLRADPSSQTFTSLDFSLNGRYRWTKNDSVIAGTSFGLVTPFQGNVATGRNGKKLDPININDPGVGYSRVGKLFGLQTVTGVSYGYGTSINSLAVDATHSFGASYNVMKSWQNGVSAGAAVSGGYQLYSSKPGESNNTRLATDQYGGDARTQWALGVFPQAEYQFTDHLSARTVFGYFNWKHFYGDQNGYRMLQTFVYQSVGVGWAVSRDVYLYPNVQFLPGNLQSSYTNVALSAVINIF